ncbi:MAG TPA: NADH:ubiquinone reductase (Na(+)-transporting) subunit F [Opitutaceae bacterium]|nr:NADH:ubiquinone reductase (Na(+)-transporting) subunit F [Opitutaceae bacterium]
MFPLVPYHALPKLHEAVKHDMPTPYPGLWSAWREIVPAVLRQVRDPSFHVKRLLPEKKSENGGSTTRTLGAADSEGWRVVGDRADLPAADVMRVDHGRKTYAVYRDAENRLYATDGICTHGNTHLADGLVKGNIIECPKHNGRFHLSDGSPARPPICRGLTTYPVKEYSGHIWLNPTQPGGAGERTQKALQLRVVSNRSVATFIKELVLEPVDANTRIKFTPGDYLQIDIPCYDEISFANFEVPEPYATVWRQQHVFDHVARNPLGGRRNNYSIASNQVSERILRFNVRIATPPPGQSCPPGVGSAYIFNLKPGDVVSAIGPFGDFHIKPTQREMIYIGGGAGMAPLRAHLSHLFETENTQRRVSFWYGARSRQEIYYRDYFEKLVAQHRNFAFHVALSSPLSEDQWSGKIGFIHDVVADHALRNHPNLSAVEFYLCGPPMMIKACSKMLAEFKVSPTQISFDEF